MMTSSRKAVLLIVAIVVQIIYALPLASRNVATKVNGCDLLSNPSRYNGKLVRVYGLVHSDYEHFDLRFKCEGYVQLETSTRETEAKKFGFKTREDDKYRQLTKGIEDRDAIGPNCIECRPKQTIVHATIEGLFRCHQDFPDCSNVSRQGDSSLVISSVKSVQVEAAKASASTH